MERITFYIVLMVLFCSCSKQEEFNNSEESAQNSHKGVIIAQAESSTRTLLNETVAKFILSDAIAVYDNLGTSYSKYSLSSGSETKYAEFTGTYTGGGSAKRTIYAVYPYESGEMAVDKKSYTFALPTEQVQNGAIDSVNLARYSYMVASPVNEAPGGLVSIVFNQVTSVVNFELKNIPEGQKITQITMKAKDLGRAPFISEGSVDISKVQSRAGFLQVIPVKLTNRISVRLNNAPASDFSANIVIFPFVSEREDMEIVVSAINVLGVVQTYTFARNNLDLSLFKRKMRTSTTLDFNTATPDTTTNETYSVWDGVSKTQPLDLNTTEKTMTITRASDLAWLAEQSNSYTTYGGFGGYVITLAANLDLGGVFDGRTWSGINWTPIGCQYPFQGSFNGAGYKIRNLYVAFQGEVWRLGLFGENEGSISNVNIESGYIDAKSASVRAGAVCAYSSGTMISNCINNASVYGSMDYAGGICGYTTSPMRNCINNGKVSSRKSGGICGYAGNTSIVNCINNGTIEDVNFGGTYSCLGGICSYSMRTNITSCVNNASVTSLVSGAYSGGIYGSGSELLSNCMNFGAIKATYCAGGLCGLVENSLKVTDSLNKGSVSCARLAGGIFGESYYSVVQQNCLNTGKIN